MAFDINFNLLANFWNNGHAPLANPPDHANVAVQLYVHGRADIDTNSQAGAVGNIWWNYPIYLRSAMADYDELNLYVECPAGSGLYYLITYTHPVHLGFPNQYMQHTVYMYSPTLNQFVLFYGTNT